jgi:hypothetical protein
MFMTLTTDVQETLSPHDRKRAQGHPDKEQAPEGAPVHGPLKFFAGIFIFIFVKKTQFFGL